ncbi:MAG: hypothetical protein KatS3mg105_5030 [Gemmatales bacterium]|nr:MAG: hypothetical protein KatS3mg105_5030 [Gemmatales bacterium]
MSQVVPIDIFRAPRSSLKYEFDFKLQDFLKTQNLASAAVYVINGDITISSPVVSGKVATMTISGETPGVAQVELVVVAADGQRLDLPINIFTVKRI